MQYNLVAKAKAFQFKDACIAGAAISMFAFTASAHQFEIKAVRNEKGNLDGYLVRVMNLNGVSVGYLGQ